MSAEEKSCHRSDLRGFLGRLHDGVNQRFIGLKEFASKNRLAFTTYLSIFISAALLRVLLGLVYGSIQYDEAAHSIGGIFFTRYLGGSLNNAMSFLNDYPMIVGSFWFYPFGYSILSVAGFSLFGFSEFAARLPSLILSIVLIHATVRLAKELESDNRTGLISAFFVAVSSMIVIVGVGAMIDVPAAVFITYALLFWIRELKGIDRRGFLKAGLFGGLAGLMKPTGIVVLAFLVGFQILLFLIKRDNTIKSKRLWVGVLVGFLLFSTWWGSALIVNFVYGGWIGGAALGGIGYWFDFLGVFGKYVPPWYSPPWYTIEAWNYYPYHLSLMMGFLPLMFSFIGVGVRLRKKHEVDFLLVLFALFIYILQTFASNKNPRYIIPCLPILYLYSAVGLNYLHKHFARLTLPKPTRLTNAATIVGSAMVILVLFSGVLPLWFGIESQYIPGMGFNATLPIDESVRIVSDDGEAGVVMLDSTENLFNVPTVTFYLASADTDSKYECYGPLSSLDEILNFRVDGKNIRYVFVYNLNSTVNSLIHSNPDHFTLIGKAENAYGAISVYKTKT